LQVIIATCLHKNYVAYALRASCSYVLSVITYIKTALHISQPV